MPEAFIVAWDLPDIQERVSRVEAMGMGVGGAEAQSPEHAVDAIRETRPDLVIVWANGHLDRTKQVLLDLRWAVDDVPPLLYVDADDETEEELERIAPGIFVPTAGLEDALKQAARAGRR